MSAGQQVGTCGVMLRDLKVSALSSMHSAVAIVNFRLKNTLIVKHSAKLSAAARDACGLVSQTETPVMQMKAKGDYWFYVEEGVSVWRKSSGT